MTVRAEPPRRHRLRLRTRVLLTFGLMASLIAAALAAVAWMLVSSFLTGQRTQAATRLAAGHAASIDDGLAAGTQDIPSLLDSLALPPTTSIVVRYDDQWYGGLPDPTRPDLPPELIALVQSGTAATQRIGEGERLVLAIGIPLPRSGGSFFELVGLNQLNNTLRVFSASLLLAVVGLGVVNAAAGWFASRVAIHPLTRLTRVASAVAEGRLDARMDADNDPDLIALARSFNQTVDTLQRRVAADARFAGDVSHELRTPLTTMINSMALLQNRRAELPAAALEPLDLLADELTRFRRLVVDLIEISRDVDAPASSHLEEIDVAELVRRAADTAAGRPVTTIRAASPIIMWADKRRLERVVANLVENAERHGDGCSVVTVRRGTDRVEVMVDDAGSGIPPDRRERIFERFTRAGTSEDGVGLGLAIVARHVQAHGGTIEVRDRPGGGGRFVVSLPLSHPGPR